MRKSINTTHLASFSFALLNPYAIAGAGVIHTEDAPAIAAVAVATLSMNPRREVVLISTSFDMESADFLATWLDCEGAKAEEGDTMARAAHAADSREEAAMVTMY